MKVYDRALTAAETGHTQDIQKLSNSTGKSTTRGTETSGDHVEFSGSLGRLSRTLSIYDTSRADRVQSLTAQYQSGNYRADSAATSRGMLSEAVAAGIQAAGTEAAGTQGAESE